VTRHRRLVYVAYAMTIDCI